MVGFLDIVTNGLKFDLKELPTQSSRPAYPLSPKENEIISIEITKLLKKLVTVYSTPNEGEFISVTFTRDKKDDNKRMILNLKEFNSFIKYKNFKMESLNNVINLIKANVYMASIDLKDAFFSVPINNDHQKYLKLSTSFHGADSFVEHLQYDLFNKIFLKCIIRGHGLLNICF